jgi:hypothetical protein
MSDPSSPSPVATRSRVMLEMACELVAMSDQPMRQVKVLLRTQGAAAEADWPLRLFGSSTFEGVEAVVSGESAVATINPSSASRGSAIRQPNGLASTSNSASRVPEASRGISPSPAPQRTPPDKPACASRLWCPRTESLSEASLKAGKRKLAAQRQRVQKLPTPPSRSSRDGISKANRRNARQTTGFLRRRENRERCRNGWWAHQGSNLGPAD